MIEFEKAALRRWMLEHRKNLSKEEMRAATSAIAKKIPPLGRAVIGTYAPVYGEIDALHISKVFNLNFALPCIEQDSKILIYRLYQGDDKLIRGKHRILCPAEDAPEVAPDILFVPLLAFDETGHRLGYGGGYYDATLTAFKEKTPGIYTIGLAYDFQQVDSLPHEAHDVILDEIVTPTARYKVKT